MYFAKFLWIIWVNCCVESHFQAQITNIVEFVIVKVNNICYICSNLLKKRLQIFLKYIHVTNYFKMNKVNLFMSVMLA